MAHLSLVQEIRQDEVYKKFSAAFNAIEAKLKLDECMKEAMSIHAGRLSRMLISEKRYSPTALLNARLDDLSNRARLAEMRVQRDIMICKLEELLKAMRRHIHTEYVDELKEYSTVDQRKSLVDRVLKRANLTISDGRNLINAIDFLIKDVDASGFSLRDAVECLKLLSERPGQIA